MVKSWKLVPGVLALVVGAAIVGCNDSNDRNSDDEQTTQKRTSSPLTTSLFEPYVAYATGSTPEAVAIGDLDGDGRNDIALLTSTRNDPANDNMVHVFLQNPDGTLQPRVRYPVGRRGSSIDIGDVNGDGRADVVVGDENSTIGTRIGVLLQNATGTLDAIVAYPTTSAYRVKVADFNGDGRADIAGLGTALDIFLQTDTGTLAPPVTYAAPHGIDLDAGDVNGDGRTDVVLNYGLPGGPNVFVLPQMPDGTIGAATSYSVNSSWSSSGVAVGDTNGDGRSDVVVTYGGNRPTSSVGRFLQNAQGALDPVVSYASYDMPAAAVLDDVDGDARKDALVLHATFSQVGVYRQYPSGDFVVEDLYPIPSGNSGQQQALATGDINGDGRLDAVVANSNNGLIVLRHVPDVSLALAVTAPVGGPYYTSAPITVRWRAGDVVPLAGFDVAVSYNNGVSYTPIAACTGLPATATECSWTPTVAGSGILMRVTARDGAGDSVSAQATFNVVTPSIALFQPMQGQPQYIGVGTTIVWNHNLPSTGTVRIELSRDGGGTYETLAAAAPITSNGGTLGMFTWTVTGPTTNNARLRVTSNDATLPASATLSFLIFAPPTTPVVVRVPYTTSLIADWIPGIGGASTVRVELSRDGGATFQTIAAAWPNIEGHFVGSVSGPGAADARLRITANGAVPATGTSDSFGLLEPTVTVTGPAAGATLYAGTSAAITWSSNLPATSGVMIHLSRDGGSTYSELAMIPTNTGSFAWTVTGPATSAARVRVTILNPGSTAATSGTFAIVVPSLTVTAPATGAAIFVGTSLAINWATNLPAESPVTVELSRTNGGSYQVLATNAPNTGNFSWVVTGPATPVALVRVTVGGPGSMSATSGTFSIVTPSLTVTGPGAGGAFYAGTPLAITWSTNVPAPSVSVELSRDGGGTFETLAAAAPNNGSFTWVVTGPDAPAAYVRVTVTDPVAISRTSGTFAITTPSLTVASPVAGTLSYTGTPVTITWTDNVPAGDTVSIELSRDGGATFEAVNAAAANTGSFAWIASGPDTTAARVRVTWNNGVVSVSDTGPAFQIITPSLAVTSPAAGANWAIGTARTIAWSSNLPAGTTARVELSRDGGSTWTTLSSAASGGSLAWTATSPTTSAAIVRVTANGGVAAVGSSGVFTIGNPAVTVTSPAAGAKWTIKVPQTITWTTNLLSTSTVKIQLSRDGGSTYTTLASSAPNTGSFAWTATGSATASAIVKVSANGFTASGVSGTFSLVAASVKVTSPNTAVIWTVGSVHAITWTHNLGASAQFKIEVSRSGVWSTITPAVPGGSATSGSYDWTVAAPTTSNAKIRVTWTGGTTSDVSDVSFRIN